MIEHPILKRGTWAWLTFVVVFAASGAAADADDTRLRLSRPSTDTTPRAAPNTGAAPRANGSPNAGLPQGNAAPATGSFANRSTLDNSGTPATRPVYPYPAYPYNGGGYYSIDPAPTEAAAPSYAPPAESPSSTSRAGGDVTTGTDQRDDDPRLPR